MKKEKMKVLHINSYYQVGKFYKFLYDEEEKNYDIKVYVPVCYDKEGEYGDYTITSKCFNKNDRFLFHLKHHKIFKDILKKINVQDYNLIHAHSLFSNGYIAYKLKKKYGINYVVAVRNTDVNVFFKKLFYLRGLGRKILKESAAIVFLSESYRNLLLDKYINKKDKESILKKSYIIPNGIDDFWFKNKYKREKLKDPSKINLVYAGRIEKNKNILATAMACELLKNKNYKVNLTIIGDITDQKYYEEIAKYDFVKWYPKMKKEELIKQYRKKDIFVMPSITETFGLVYVEAMSQSLPIIYSKGQGFDGQFKEGEVGYHVDATNIEDIANKIIKIINNYDIIKDKCYNSFNKFNWTDIASKCGLLYEKISQKD